MRLRIGVAHLAVELETFDGRYIALGTRSGIPKDDVPENGPTVARVDSYRPCHDGTLPPFESNPVYRKTVHVENWATTQVFSSGEIPYFPADRADRVQNTGTLKEGLPC